MQTLRIARLVFGIPLSALAAKAGVSTKEIARIERGDVWPRPETFAAVDAAFVELLGSRLDSAGADR